MVDDHDGVGERGPTTKSHAKSLRRQTPTPSSRLYFDTRVSSVTRALVLIYYLCAVTFSLLCLHPIFFNTITPRALRKPGTTTTTTISSGPANPPLSPPAKAHHTQAATTPNPLNTPYAPPLPPKPPLTHLATAKMVPIIFILLLILSAVATGLATSYLTYTLYKRHLARHQRLHTTHNTTTRRQQDLELNTMNPVRAPALAHLTPNPMQTPSQSSRSEERRVGKECPV